ncbi:MAG: hypothetical protein K0R02_687 [Rickettsiaceae bacterium]|jgi:hypothetical protein|nr:hypothetical protein [Rickettsiaceae bacterium]
MGYYTYKDKKKRSLKETAITYTILLGILMLAFWNFIETWKVIYNFFKNLIN